MRKYGLTILLLFTILSVAVVAQYQYYGRFGYATPRVAYYPTTMCNMVDATQGSPSCYRDGLLSCMRANTGYCFSNCLQHVRNLCFEPRRIPDVSIPSGFERAYGDRAQCINDVNLFCTQNEARVNERRDCMQRGYTRCSYIGRIFD